MPKVLTLGNFYYSKIRIQKKISFPCSLENILLSIAVLCSFFANVMFIFHEHFDKWITLKFPVHIIEPAPMGASLFQILFSKRKSWKSPKYGQHFPKPSREVIDLKSQVIITEMRQLSRFLYKNNPYFRC